MFQKTWFKLLIASLFLLAALYSIFGTQLTYLEQKELERKNYEESLRSMQDSPLDGSPGEALKFFPLDEAWNIEGVFIEQQEATAESFNILMTDGTSEQMEAAGEVEFEKGGKLYRLKIFDEPESYLLPFSDETSGKTTYGGGRYINIPKKGMKNGKLKIDFNDASNFYCAYSPNFICPIPPKENRLPFDVAAGEKVFKSEEVL